MNTSSPVPTPKDRRHGCMLWAFVLVGFMLLLCGTPGFMLVRWQTVARRDVKQEIDRIRERGEPLTPQEVDDAYQLPDGATDTTRLWMDASNLFESEEFQRASQTMPFIGTQATIEKPPIGNEWADLTNAQQLLKTYEAAFEKLHTAAAEGGAARYPSDFSKGHAVLVPHLQELRSSARVLQLEAYVRAHEQDAAGVTRSLNTLMALEHSLANEPFLISQLVRVAIGGNACITLDDVLPHLDFSEEQLRQLRDVLMSSDVNEGIYRAMIAERAMGYAEFDSPSSAEMLTYTSRPLRDADRALFLRQMRERIELTQQPWMIRQGGNSALDDEISQLIRGSPINAFKYQVSALVVPPTETVSEAAALSDARRNLAVTALATQIYCKRHGGLPDELAQLDPDLLRQAPVDPYSSRPLKYTRHEHGYTLYSIGKNGNDDGGKGDLAGDPDVVFSVEFNFGKSSIEPPRAAESPTK